MTRAVDLFILKRNQSFYISPIPVHTNTFASTDAFPHIVKGNVD